MNKTPTVVPGLPPVAELVSLVKDEGPGVLDAFAPAIDRYADAKAAAGWLAISVATVYRERCRVRNDGLPAWPEPDLTAGQSGMWQYRTLVLWRAASPGRGSMPGQRGGGRPRKTIST
jgi:hypothetical protein